MSTIYLYLKKHLFQRRFFYLILCTALVCPMLLLTGCQNATGSDTATGKKPISINSIKLNTAVQITIYDSQDKSLLDDCLALCDKYELIFSRTNEKSELYKLNHRISDSNGSDTDRSSVSSDSSLKDKPSENQNTEAQHTPYQVNNTTDTWHISEDLAALLSKGLAVTRESNGAFDIAIAPLTSLWDFTAEDPKVPDDSDIQNALPLCSSDGITIDGQDISLPSDGIQFDVGAIAKGYIADQVKELLVAQGVEHAVLNLGRNILLIGDKQEGTAFTIGIQDPNEEEGDLADVVSATGKSIVTSGIDERYFTYQGKKYHHILDPYTGFPADTGLASVTILSDTSAQGDALSTTCFQLGIEKGMALVEQLDDVEALFITTEGELIPSSGYSNIQEQQ